MLELRADDVVLEIGTGLGYQSAVLAELAGKVYSVEIIEELAQSAVQRLKAFCAVSAPPPNLRYAPTTQWLMAPARSAPFFTLATRCFLAKI
jgi:Protein-L-isoaspartate(D-aspartate) O-methyltransferase (PCMT)